MRKEFTFPCQDSFTHALMARYKSPGLHIPYPIRAFKQDVSIIEQRSTYRVLIGNKVKRFTTLYCMAEWIFNETFDRRYIRNETLFDIEPCKLSQASKYVKKIYLTKLINALSGWHNKLQLVEGAC